MNAVEQVKKRVLKIYWTCGAEDCTTQHTSEHSATRCPARTKALNKERGYCTRCGQQFDRELPGTEPFNE